MHLKYPIRTNYLIASSKIPLTLHANAIPPVRQLSVANRHSDYGGRRLFSLREDRKERHPESTPLACQKTVLGRKTSERAPPTPP